MNPSVKTCYVSIPFGIKPDPDSGGAINFARVYDELIRPAVEQAGLECLRADDFIGTLVHKDIAKAVLTADVMLADVSGGNPNVLYELGMRHAVRRGATLLISHTRLPSNVASSRSLFYRIGSDGGPDPSSLRAARDELAHALTTKAESISTDSPLYEYFPGLQVQLPADLQRPDIRPRTYPEEAQSAGLHGPDRKRAVKRAERAVRGAADVDPQAFLDVMRRWAALGAWEEVIRAGEGLPAKVAAMPEVAQAQAVAWSRLGETERAIALLEDHIERSGGDAESRGLLGSLLKKQHLASGTVESLDAAIEQYRLAFASSPQDLYLGRNLVQLLHRRGTDAGRRELAQLLPELRALASARAGEGVSDFWTLESALLLALIAGDEPDADRLVDKMLALHPDEWVLSAARAELSGVLERSDGTTQRSAIARTIVRLKRPTVEEEEEEEEEEAGDAEL